MDNVNRGAGHDGVGDHFMDRRREAWVAVGAIPHVDEAGPAVTRRQRKDLLDFLGPGLGSVVEPEADAEAALF
jgi:hypothetical protein